MYILGISAFYHDSSACLIKDGEILAAAQEERFTRIKHDSSFPHFAIQYCLKEANIKCNVYTSPHILKINERFVFNNQELKDDELADLFEEVEKVNNNQRL